MILRLQLSHFFLSLFLFTSFTAAWPWPPSLQDIEGLILRRDDSKSGEFWLPSVSGRMDVENDLELSLTNRPIASSAAPSKGSATAPDTSKPQKTTPPDSASGKKTAKDSAAATTGGSSAAASASGSGAAASGTETGSAAQTTDVDPRLPPGGVNMITPSPMETTYYKVGDYVTFAWNYTSLSVSPKKVDVLVSCSANSATYTLSSNVSFEKSATVLWDTGPDETGTAPLLTETYTLMIMEAGKGTSATPEAGHLGAYDQFYFGMYIPQPYTPRAGKSSPLPIKTKRVLWSQTLT